MSVRFRLSVSRLFDRVSVSVDLVSVCDRVEITQYVLVVLRDSLRSVKLYFEVLHARRATSLSPPPSCLCCARSLFSHAARAARSQPSIPSLHCPPVPRKNSERQHCTSWKCTSMPSASPACSARTQSSATMFITRYQICTSDGEVNVRSHRGGGFSFRR